MDQRRLFLFLVLCFLLMAMFGPRSPKPKEKADPADKNAVAELAEENGAAEAHDQSDAVDEGDDAPPLAEDVDAKLEYVSLGSVDPDSPYRMAVTFTNQGAGVRRVELSNPRFRDLHDIGGYIGHLELAEDETGGLRVQAVATGTPAAVAGIEIGDRLVSVDGLAEAAPLKTNDDLKKILADHKPGDELTILVARGDAEAAPLKLTLARRPLEVIRPEIENVLLRKKTLDAPVASPPSFQFTFEQIGAKKLPSSAQIEEAVQAALSEDKEADIPTELVGVALRDSNWEVAARDTTSVTFRKRLPKFGLEVEKQYKLEPVPEAELENRNFPGYHITLNLVVRNVGKETLPLRYRLDGANGLPLEGWWYANKIGIAWTVGLRDVIVYPVGGDANQIGASTIAKGDVEPTEGLPLAFVGIDAQYFSAMMIPQKPTLETEWIDEMRCVSLSPTPKAKSTEGRFINTSCQLISSDNTLAAGKTLEHSYKIFLGPKRPELLSNYRPGDSQLYGLNKLVTYGWFGAVAKAMLWFLHLIYGIVGNYGIAIVMLTVVVKGCMFPISRKQVASMAKMQELRPEMDRIKERYKQDMQKQSQATQELYRKHKINPLAGCLPLFIQMPIFLGLYRALMVDVELRQAPLLGSAVQWCSNLAAPDMFYNWSSFMPDFVNNAQTMLVGMGPYLNILPIVTASLFLLQQYLFMPEAANEQAAMQQKMMKYMMLLMGFMFFKVAAGLCLYFIASSIWGIIERKMLPKPTPPAESLALADGPSTPDLPSKPNTEGAKRRKKSAQKKKKK